MVGGKIHAINDEQQWNQIKRRGCHQNGQSKIQDPRNSVKLKIIDIRFRFCKI